MATHSSILTCRIPWTEEPGGLQSIGLQTAGHYQSDLAQCTYNWFFLPLWRTLNDILCYMSWQSKRSLVIKLGILWWEDYPGSSRISSIVTREAGAAELKRRWRCRLTLGMEEGVTTQGTHEAPRSCESKRDRFSPRASRGIQPCRHHGFNQIKSILDLWHSKL